MVGLGRIFAHFLKLRSYLYDTCMYRYGLEFPPQTSEASGGNSVNRIACESRT